MSTDTILFDPVQFQAELAKAPSSITVFKNAIKKADEILNQKFCDGYDIRKLIAERAHFVDQLLIKAWNCFDWKDQANISFLAVGGYGRGELHPHSDIDVLVLINNGYEEQYKETVEQFLTLLWDIGLDIGYSVRSLDECIEQARNDLTVITNLLECRTLIGSNSLRKRLLHATDTEHMWPSADFFVHKYREQQERHEKYNDTEYNLEPNVKGSPGGLRDIQTILWIGRREYGRLSLHAMVSKGFITENEYRIMLAIQTFLWKVRYALHLLAKRGEDRLLLDYQAKVAQLLGYTELEGKAAIEKLMKRYYRAVMAASIINELIYQHFKEVILEKNKRPTITKLNKRFQICDNFIEVTHFEVFKETPSALLEIFLILGKHPEIWGIRANTIRLLYENRDLIDEKFRENRKNTKLFIEIFQCKSGVHRNLRWMSRFGILGRYIPAFGHIMGQMQYDLFHIYTVDAHTLNVIKQIRKLSRPDRAEKYPIASHEYTQLPKPELVYLAGLFHDLGKGSGGDHSEIGAQMVAEFCKLHRISDEDTKLIVWLVANHLLLSTTAQRKDLTDPDVINEFAKQVGNENYLNHLLVLTVADINATNPTLWNSWRATLLRQLFTETKRALQRGLGNLRDRPEQIEETQQRALQMLGNAGIDLEAIEELWLQMGDDYFLRHAAEDVVWHTKAILEHGNSQDPLILIKEAMQLGLTSATQIFIYAPDQRDFFAVTVAIMDQLNLSIQDARIITSSSQFTLDTFIVLNADGSSIGDDQERLDTIKQRLFDGLKNPKDYTSIIHRRVSRQLKHFTFQPIVSIYNNPQYSSSIIQIEAPDRPGLLARIGQIFLSFNLAVQGAKIITLGEKVEDIFFVTDKAGNLITDPQLMANLKKTIIEKLSETPPASTNTFTVII